MKVFISWSGDVSQKFAAALAEWLPNVIQSVKPFFSSEAIRKGSGWHASVSNELDQSNFGILCVTPDNKNAPWLHFEAGALAKNIKQAHVCPLLLGIKAVDLEGPLVHFQATPAIREEVWKLLTSINSALGEGALEEGRLKTAFEKNWDELEAAISTATAKIGEEQKSTGASVKRTPDDMFEEILNVSRGIGRQMEEIRMEVFMPKRGTADAFSAALNPLPKGLLDDSPVLNHSTLKKPGYGMGTSRQRALNSIAPNSPNVQAAPIPENSPDKNKK